MEELEDRLSDVILDFVNAGLSTREVGAVLKSLLNEWDSEAVNRDELEEGFRELAEKND